MLIADLIHSCSNDKIAQAAVASIGGGFAERVRATACENGVNTGRFVAFIVRDFGRRASEKARRTLEEKVAGADQPLLFGLRHIVESALEEGAVFFDDSRGFRPRAVPSNCYGAGVDRLQ